MDGACYSEREECKAISEGRIPLLGGGVRRTGEELLVLKIL